MEQAELERAREMFEREVRKRFDGATIAKVELLQYGEEPEVEPGGLLGRVTVAGPDGQATTGRKEREQALDEFHTRYKEAIHDFAKELRARAGSVTLEFHVEGQSDDVEEPHGPVIKLKLGRGTGALGGGDPSLTAVMARLGPEDLETLDMLIGVGIAGSRAEAVRWALARIRERPAYEQIRAHSRQIEDLKSQF
ncbi:MAG TPA: hypothetical protein VMG38_25555 [Trebonia sp.]|nr:hypothetical protein [Trebonia sp.]